MLKFLIIIATKNYFKLDEEVFIRFDENKITILED